MDKREAWSGKADEWRSNSRSTCLHCTQKSQTACTDQLLKEVLSNCNAQSEWISNSRSTCLHCSQESQST